MAGALIAGPAMGQTATQGAPTAPPAATGNAATVSPAPVVPPSEPATAAPVASGVVTDASQVPPDTAGAPADIVVTGSRITRNGFNAPTPVTVATADKLFQQTPTNIADGLNKLPALSASFSPTTQNGSGNSRSGNYLNLRSFGFNRVLVLLDGHRVVSTSTDNTVDINTIPQLLLQRVDIVTAGASAVYGSDAVTGIVNFIPDNKFVGYKGVAQSGISQRGDNGSQRVGLAGGWQFGERAHLELEAEYFHSDGILNKESRPLGRTVVTETGAGTTANPYVQTTNARISTVTYGGLIATGPATLVGKMFMPDGTLATFNPGTSTGTVGLASGGDGAYYRDTGLVAGLETKQSYGRFDYQLTDSIDVYVRGNYANSLTSQRGLLYADSRLPGSTTGIVIYSGNAFLPASVQQQLTQTNTASFQLGRFSQDFGSRPVLSRTESYTAAAGANGKLFGNFKWDLFYGHGQSVLTITSKNNINNPNFYAAVDAVRDGSGNVVCRVTVTNPGLYPGCQPLNLFGEGSPSAAALAFIEQDTSTRTVNKLDNVAANVTGDLVNLWAGPLSVATGFEFRQVSLFTTSNVNFGTIPDYTGLRGGFNATRTLRYQNTAIGVGGGRNTVWEVNGEAALPLFKDWIAGKSLDATGAVRFTHYRFGGNAVTWKAGLNYEPISGLRFRGVASRDIRAPTLSDLFAGRAVSQLSYSDLHTGRSGSTQQISQGNPDLVPEIARTYSAGVVVRPAFLRNFSASVDYFSIRINNAIASVGGNDALPAAACEQSNGTSPLCALIIRPLPFADKSAANFPTALIQQNLNVGIANTHGWDFEADYQLDRDVLVPGVLGFRLLGTYQPVSNNSNFPGTPVLNTAGTAANSQLGLTKWRVSLSTDYSIGNFSFNITGRYRSRMLPSPNLALVFIDSIIPKQFTADATMIYKFAHTGVEAFFSVNNLFDKKPAPYGNLSNTSSPGSQQAQGPGEDVVLRYFTTGLRFKF